MSRFLLIAVAIGFVSIAALYGYGRGVRDAAPHVSPPPVGVEEVLVQESGRDASRYHATPMDAGDASVDSVGASVSRAERSSPGPATRIDGTDSEFENARRTLAAAIEAHLPGLALSANDLEDLADATLRLRSARAGLRALPKTREHAERRALERRRLEEAVADFTYLVEMTPAEFTRRIEPKVGVDEWNPDATPGDVSIRPIRASEEPE